MKKYIPWLLLFFLPSLVSAQSNQELVRNYFHDNPLMYYVIGCESGFRQFNYDGSPLISTTSDYGIAQINKIHLPRARSLGLDVIHSTIDNLMFAQILFSERSFKPWVCFQKLHIALYEPEGS